MALIVGGTTVTGTQTLDATKLTGNLPAIDGSSLTGVGASTTYSAVGTYVFANAVLSSGQVNPGGTSVAASNLRATNVSFQNLHTLSGGTWRVMGSIRAGAAGARTSLFVRVS